MTGDRHQHPFVARRVEREDSGQEAIEHHARGVEIGADVRVLHRYELLGRGVTWGAEHGPRTREPRLIRRLLGDAEVEDDGAHGRLFAEEHVAGLEVAVDDARSMRCLEPMEDLVHEKERVAQPARAFAIHPALHRLTDQILERQEGHLGHSAVEHLHDVRRVDARGDLGLAQEPLNGGGVSRITPKELERNQPIQVHVARAIDRAMSSDADEGLELVAVERGPDQSLWVFQHSPIMAVSRAAE